jgi:K+-transporting ATPase ATPase C chain
MKVGRASVMMLLVMTVLTGGIFPLVVTGVAWLAFPHQAGGSLVVREGRVVGSELVGQPFHADELFWSRPSATGPVAYNAAASSGSNLGPLNPALAEAVGGRVAELKAQDASIGRVPVDLVTASGSGLDPHISPAAAEVQVGRVARARGLDESTVRDLVKRHTLGRQLGVLGEPRVNVLMLNLDLQALGQSQEGGERP